MDHVRVTVRTHGLNGWFLRLFSTPYAVTGASEHRLAWAQAVSVPLSDEKRVGVSVRSLGKGGLLGVDEAH